MDQVQRQNVCSRMGGCELRMRIGVRIGVRIELRIGVRIGVRIGDEDRGEDRGENELDAVSSQTRVRCKD